MTRSCQSIEGHTPTVTLVFHIRTANERHEYGWIEDSRGSTVVEHIRGDRAALIVRAVNAYQPMKDALDELYRCASAIAGADPNDPDAEDAFDMFYEAKAKARAALRLSEGEGSKCATKP